VSAAAAKRRRRQATNKQKAKMRMGKIKPHLLAIRLKQAAKE